MGSLFVRLHWTLSDLERTMSRSLRILKLIYREGAELEHMLTLKNNRKAYMWRTLVRIHLILETLKGQCRGHSDSEGLYLVKELIELGHVLN